MSRPGRRFVFLRPRYRLPALFVVGILLPGIALAVFSARALIQERQLADQEIRERLGTVAEVAIRELDDELRQWQRAVEELAGSGTLVESESTSSTSTAPMATWPDRVRQAIASPGSGVLIFRNGGDLGVLPAGQLLYRPAATVPSPLSTQRPRGIAAVELAAAELAELRDKDFPRALELYERLLPEADSDDRALLVHRLARTSKKAGLQDQAFGYYRVLERAESALVGSLPAALIAKYELCSLWVERGAGHELEVGARSLYEGLVSGRWPMEKSRYLFYAEQARGWLRREIATSPTPEGSDARQSPEMVELRETENAKLALTSAVEELLERPQRLVSSGDRISLAFWQAEPFVTLVLSTDFVRERIWQPVAAEAGDSDLELRLLGPSGEIVFGTTSPAEGVPGARPARVPAVEVRRSLAAIDLPLSLWVLPSSTSTLRADLARRQTLYLAMLTLVVALLAFGSYITVRTVKREVEVARLKSHFVSAVSHEFRSPLTGIRQLGEMLARGRVKNEERKQAYYRMIVRESSRLTRLVENFLDLSRIEEARKEYELEPVEAGDWLRQVVEEFRQELSDTDVALVAGIPDELPVVRGDREALTCAVHNLLDNAVKYSTGSDKIWLEAEATDGKLAVGVRDQGVGISKEDQKHIFEKFFRGGGEISEAVKGVGLGLSLVQHIVKAHGGAIGLRSEPGAGSTFTIELPAEPRPAAEVPSVPGEK